MLYIAAQSNADTLPEQYDSLTNVQYRLAQWLTIQLVQQWHGTDIKQIFSQQIDLLLNFINCWINTTNIMFSLYTMVHSLLCHYMTNILTDNWELM